MYGKKCKLFSKKEKNTLHSGKTSCILPSLTAKIRRMPETRLPTDFLLVKNVAIYYYFFFLDVRITLRIFTSVMI